MRIMGADPCQMVLSKQGAERALSKLTTLAAAQAATQASEGWAHQL